MNIQDVTSISMEMNNTAPWINNAEIVLMH